MGKIGLPYYRLIDPITPILPIFPKLIPKYNKNPKSKAFGVFTINS